MVSFSACTVHRAELCRAWGFALENKICAFMIVWIYGIYWTRIQLSETRFRFSTSQIWGKFGNTCIYLLSWPKAKLNSLSTYHVSATTKLWARDSKTERRYIICPWWFDLHIIFASFAIVFWDQLFGCNINVLTCLPKNRFFGNYVRLWPIFPIAVMCRWMNEIKR